METGGIAATYTESERGVTAQERMTLTSGVFIGGLPRPYDVRACSHQASLSVQSQHCNDTNNNPIQELLFVSIVFSETNIASITTALTWC